MHVINVMHHCVENCFRNHLLQVLSETVSNVLHTFGGPEAGAEFVEMFDKWFDALNVCNFSDGKTQQKHLNIHIDLQMTFTLR